MFSVIKGLGLLVLTLILFSVFSLKVKKGDKAMSGLAGAAVATFLVEAVHKYISGDFLGFDFLGEVGLSSGSMGGVIAVILVGLNMGVNPIYAAVAGAAMSGLGILPGFIAGYTIGLLGPHLERVLPKGLDIILGALLIAPLARVIGVVSTPLVDSTLLSIGEMIQVAATQSPILMGFFLGGIMKIMCTSPLSSMALTAMLGLQGLAMGIASIASFAGAFTNGIVFKRLKLGEKGSTLAVMLEPLTQADIITKNPLPIYISDFIGGGLGGVVAAYLGIVNNAPGTASPIPGMLAPFGFNAPSTVILALTLAAVGGIIGGYVGTYIYITYRKLKNIKANSSKNNDLVLE
ncbi:PTS sugar transporter subunit IIC [Clostridium sp. D2Q-11]|uniref:PTS sugar transporter subunit IIC n=1 Tax=Anaeromonas frigoriresistens TaxID=2683708 RepID=A0A942Z9P5_9FIRM|nr:PTS sugar transporter subunit IIC [Anaeromonas frigoriresistens]MBS4539543.1 PTS sugar transporter subunit IIC [Anaeromonas frigoriresistens]